MRQVLAVATRWAGRGLLLVILLAGASLALLALGDHRMAGGMPEEIAAETARITPAAGPAAVPVPRRPPSAGGGDDTADLAMLRARAAADAVRLDTLREGLETLRAEMAALRGPRTEAAEIRALRAELGGLRAEVAALARDRVERRQAAQEQPRAFPAAHRPGDTGLGDTGLGDTGQGVEAAGRQPPRAPEAAADPVPPAVARPILARAAAAGSVPPAPAAGPQASSAPATGPLAPATVTIHRRAGSVAARRASAQVAEEIRRAGLDVAAVREEAAVPGDRLIRGATPEAARLAALFRERWGHAWQVSEAAPRGGPASLEVWLPHR